MAVMLVIAMCSAFVGIKPMKSNAICNNSSPDVSQSHLAKMTDDNLTENNGNYISKAEVSQKTYLEGVNSELQMGADVGNTGIEQLVSSISEFSYAEGVINKLSSDISGNLTLNGETYNIDLAGHKWSNSTNAIILGLGSIYVYDSVGGGSIETTLEDAVNMGNGSAKFKNITIRAGGDNMDAIYCGGGNLVVENCILSAPKAGINAANDSEYIDASARAVVTVNGGKFAKYSGIVDSQGRNCAIEIRNNADEITLIGKINFENNKIISKVYNEKSIKDAITADATYVSGVNISDYVTATINYNGSTSGNSGNTGEEDSLKAGDVNSDGVVNSIDTLCLKRHLSGGWNIKINELVVDVNNDGSVNATDVLWLKRYLAGGWNIELQIPGGENPDSGNTGDGGNTEEISIIEVSNINEFYFNVGMVNKLTTNISGGLRLGGRILVVDLNGHTWSNGENVIVLDTGSVYVYDSVGGGKIQSSNKDAINMGNGSAKFENITITAGGDGMDAIRCNGGKLDVIDCTLSAPKAGINIANESEAIEANARSVVSVSGGKFANYTGTKDSQGRNCAIEIGNHADEITLSGDIIFENDIIISELSNYKSIKDAITANATYTDGNYLQNYVTAKIAYGTGGSTGDNPNPDVTLDELANKVVVPANMNVDFKSYLEKDSAYKAKSGLMAFKKNMLCAFNGKVSYPLDVKIVELNGVLFADAENFVKMFGLNFTKGSESSAVIYFNNFSITIKANSNTISINGKDFNFVTTLLYKESFLISIEDFIKAMGYKFTYDSGSGIYFFYNNSSDYSNTNINAMKSNIKNYEDVVYNYDDVECDQTGVGLYKKSEYKDRLVGVAYTTWNRTSFPWTNSWSYPLVGKYASNNKEVVRQHGIWLAEAGVDFVFVDWSNNTTYHPDITGGTREDFEMIEKATDVLFEVWSQIPNAPKICIFVGPGHSGIESVSSGEHQRKVNQVYNDYINNAKNREMYFYYEGKPLLMCYGATPTQYGANPSWTDNRFTIRWVTGYVGQQGSLYNKQTRCSYRYWSWEEREAQTYTVKDGVVEAVTCSAATRAQNSPGQSGYIPAHGKENGQTLKKQFQRAIDLGASIVLVVSWNEWTSSEQGTAEYAKDIEPSEIYGTYYYDLMRELIKKFKGKV